MPLVSSIERAFVWRFFSGTFVLRFMPVNEKSAFTELINFKTLFLVKFKAFTLDQNHHALEKLSCKSACETRCCKCTTCSRPMLFAANNCTISKCKGGSAPVMQRRSGAPDTIYLRGHGHPVYDYVLMYTNKNQHTFNRSRG